MMRKVGMLLSAFRNFKNWGEYAFNKTRRKERALTFVTKPYPLVLAITKEGFDVFREIFIADFYDIRNILKHIPNNPVVVDIGANTGMFSFLLLSKVPRGRYLLFEPLPENLTAIRATLENNRQFEKRVRLFPNAVGINAGEKISFYVSTHFEYSPVASVFKDFDPRNTTTISVETTNLETIIRENELSKIDVLKIDCEGSEYPILYNASAETLSKIKLMLIEVHPMDNHANNNAALVSFLNTAGFVTESKLFDNNCYFTLAVNKKNG